MKAVDVAVAQQDPAWWTPRVGRPPLAGLGRLRKIALIGGANTLQYAPWFDPSWEIWAHASCRKRCHRAPDLFWDLHPKVLWSNPKKKWWDPAYLDWLKTNPVPIMMQERFTAAPASIKFPFASVIAQWQPHTYFTNHVAWMIAYALGEGVTHIGLYGCHYDSDSEYGPQRGSAEFWCGVAIGRGVQIIIPPGCDLLNNPPLLYGYESHPDGVRDPSYNVTVKKKPAVKTPTEPVSMTMIDETKAEGRPPLMDIGQPVAWDRSGHSVHA